MNFAIIEHFYLVKKMLIESTLFEQIIKGFIKLGNFK